MSKHCVPLEGPLGQWLGRELKDAALNGVPDRLLESACGYISGMLSSDPSSVFETVLLPASRTDGKAMISLSVREDFRRNLAVAARNYDINLIVHEPAPVATSDSAAIAYSASAARPTNGVAQRG